MARLVSSGRLVTLVGTGGVGKTRLALEAAVAVSGRFGAAIDFVDLGAVVDPATVPGAVAKALGIEERAGGDAVERLAAVLRPQRRLLILDNCEHLRGTCAALASGLLSRCPGVVVLATSRERLGIPGEVVWRVPSLAFPAAGAAASMEILESYEAVALFLARARDARPGLVIRPAELPAVASICCRLDGNPLALELAAARVSALSLADLADRLTDSFGLLVRADGGPARQKTLRASIEWSHESLGDAERVLFRRLAVFAGGWALDDAEAICAGRPLAPGEVARVLTMLVDKSLVQADQAGAGSWYRLPEAIRAFAGERLIESGERANARDRHGSYFAELGERSAPILLGADQTAWASRLDQEMPNLRAARQWCGEDAGRAELGLRLASGLWEYWHVRGILEEGARWLEDALAPAPGPASARAAAMSGLGVILAVRGELERGRELLEHAISLYQHTGDSRGQARAWTHLGNVHTFRGDLANAADALGRGLALARLAPGSWHEAWALLMCALADTMSGNIARARAQLAESSALFTRNGDHRAVGYTLVILGNCLVLDGAIPDAVRTLREAMIILEALPDRFGTTQATCVLAIAAAGTGDWPRVATLLGIIDSLSERISARLFPPVAEIIEGLARTTSDMLGPAMAPAREAGRAVGRTDAIAAALWENRDRATKRAADGRRLTTREQEVAGLVALGLTNQQIARRLFISRRTADTHVQRILAKLGCANRAQVAVIVATRQPPSG